MKWSTEEAQAYAVQDRTEEWVDAYLRTGAWANKGLADGLKNAPRWWLGPVLVPVNQMIRTCGPEEGMVYGESSASWVRKTDVISQSLEEPRSLPPVILEGKDSALYLRDGNHRHGVAQQKDWEYMWALVWFNSEEEMKASKLYKAQHPEKSNESDLRR